MSYLLLYNFFAISDIAKKMHSANQTNFVNRTIKSFLAIVLIFFNLGSGLTKISVLIMMLYNADNRRTKKKLSNRINVARHAVPSHECEIDDSRNNMKMDEITNQNSLLWKELRKIRKKIEDMETK